MLEAGTRLGPYEIQAAIGAGGMGEVYRARDTRLDRTVAIKILPPQFAGDPILRERFDREARLISSLNHPHICALFDVGEQRADVRVIQRRDQPCFAIESLAQDWIAGELRREYLDRDRAIEPRVAGAIDLTHSASADSGLNLVRPETSAGFKHAREVGGL